jgi:hypothetical protein
MKQHHESVIGCSKTESKDYDTAPNGRAMNSTNLTGKVKPPD